MTEKVDWIKAVFIECDTCRALPGTPVLCAGCLHNRRTISFLTSEYRDLGARMRSAIEAGQTMEDIFLPNDVER